jgi:hypothetical protein
MSNKVKKVKGKKKERDYNAILKIYDLPNMSSYKISRLINWLESFKDIEKEDKKKFNRIYTCKLMK